MVQSKIKILAYVLCLLNILLFVIHIFLNTNQTNEFPWIILELEGSTLQTFLCEIWLMHRSHSWIFFLLWSTNFSFFFFPFFSLVDFLLQPGIYFSHYMSRSNMRRYHPTGFTLCHGLTPVIKWVPHSPFSLHLMRWEENQRGKKWENSRVETKTV